MKNSLYEQLPEREAGLAVGVLLGDKSGISEAIKEDFRTDGVSHLLAVSGLHMAAVCQLLLFFFRKILHFPEKLCFLFSMVGIIAFMAITGFAPSVMRSGIMYLIYLAGLIVSRQADSLNSLGAAVFLMCLVNPYAAADIGLLLSFSATAALILFSGKTVRLLRTYLPLQSGIPKEKGLRIHLLRAVGNGIRRFAEVRCV